MSLGARGSVLLQSGDATAAAVQFREGIECLKPLFLWSPQPFRLLMTSLIRDYLQACKTAAIEPDYALLADILPKLGE